MSDPIKQLLDSIKSPGDLRQLLEIPGVTNEVIEQFVTGPGADDVLDQIFNLMAAHYLPERARGRGGVVQWNIDTPGGRRRYQLKLTPTKATAQRGTPDRPKVTLTMSTPMLLRLCSGKLNPVKAVRARKIKIKGNLIFGARMARWFDY